MRAIVASAFCIAAIAAIIVLAGSANPTLAANEGAADRGAYLFAAADCSSCHTDAANAGKPLAGGRALATPFGTFYSPNITPDVTYGIGSWTEADFHRAMREGIGPGGTRLFPVFPFTSFTGMTDNDIADLFAYLKAQTPVPQPNKPHDVTPPFGWRFGLVFWRLLFFTEGPLALDPRHDAEWNRGNYLANAVVHCGECHTPRNFMGALKTGAAFSGNAHGPDGQDAPNITSNLEHGIGKWSIAQIETLLKTRETPSGDKVGKGMAQVVRGTSQLTDADRHAIAVYVISLKPLP